MSRLFLPLILLFLIAFQGVNQHFVPLSLVESGYIITIHTVLIFLILITLYYDLETSYYGLLYAILSGFLIDTVYTPLLGVYMFSYAITIYLVHSLRKFLQVNLFVSSFLIVVGITSLEFLLYWVYTFVGITEVPIQNFLVERLMWTVIFNLALFFLFFLVFKRPLIRFREGRFEDKKNK